MQKRFHLYLLLLFILIALFPTATALAQAGQTLYIPRIIGEAEPPLNTPKPAPYDVEQPCALAILPSDLDGNDYVLRRRIPVNDERQPRGIVRACIIGVGHQQDSTVQIESEVIVFLNERLAQEYLLEVPPRSWETEGFKRDNDDPDHIVYVRQSTKQGITYFHSHAVVREKNVLLHAHSIEVLSGAADPMHYSEKMLNKLRELYP